MLGHLDLRGELRDDRGVDQLADCSVAVWLFDGDTDNLGLAHVPRPVEPGDLLALADGPALQVTVIVQLPAGGIVEAVAG